MSTRARNVKRHPTSPDRCEMSAWCPLPPVDGHLCRGHLAYTRILIADTTHEEKS